MCNSGPTINRKLEHLFEHRRYTSGRAKIFKLDFSRALGNFQKHARCPLKNTTTISNYLPYHVNYLAVLSTAKFVFNFLYHNRKKWPFFDCAYQNSPSRRPPSWILSTAWFMSCTGFNTAASVAGKGCKVLKLGKLEHSVTILAEHSS